MSKVEISLQFKIIFPNIRNVVYQQEQVRAISKAIVSNLINDPVQLHPFLSKISFSA